MKKFVLVPFSEQQENSANNRDLDLDLSNILKDEKLLPHEKLSRYSELIKLHSTPTQAKQIEEHEDPQINENSESRYSVEEEEEEVSEEEEAFTPTQNISKAEKRKEKSDTPPGVRNKEWLENWIKL
jgi:hypothetical protein